ncbi:Mbov_0397 family ICE element conjugal transfer ATPase [Mesomycoplasma lagogenitalium]|uniref:DUF87 domain-containing protein n=1 Tax=Mesomycoplasma lagogenitalium TaxID=171286 RepID=A0ABY8LSR1_9BACT|nr:DUF87 domain-containing protein [Mesomycoplasma lagogenitalium]WGI36294.1 DUF87 domain-containing protein [Mesomycoplasma lagogenitalium]
MLQPKSIKKNKILIYTNLYLSDIIFCFSLIFFIMIVGWFIIPNYVKHKKIISISLIVILILFSLPLMIYIPSHNARLWITCWRIFKYWTENKIYSKKSKNANIKSLYNFKNIDEKGNIELKNLILSKYKYLKIVEFTGINIWNKNISEKKYFLDQFINIFNSIDYKISFIKLNLNDNLSEKINDIDSQISFETKNQNIQNNIIDYLNENKKEFQDLEKNQSSDRYYAIFYSHNIETLEENFQNFADLLDKLEINTNALNKKQTSDFLFKFYNPYKKENLNNDFFPNEIKFKKDHFIVDGICGKIETIGEYSIDLNIGWAETFFNSNDSWIVWHLENIETDDYEKILNAANNKILTNIAFNKKSLYRNKKDIKNMEAINETMMLVNVENQKLFRSTILFANFANNIAELKNKIQFSLHKDLKTEKCKVNKLNYRQIEGYYTYSFLNNDKLKESTEMVSRNIAYSWPFVYEQNIDKNSFYVGRNRKQTIILDIWKRNTLHTNSNCIFFGTSGRGKTTAIKKLILDNYLKNKSSVIIIDPQREYQDFSDIFNISWIDLGVGNTTINPLQILANNNYSKNVNNEILISNHITFFMNWIKILIPNWTEEKETIINMSLKSLYKKFNLYNIKNLLLLENKKFPIFDDFIKEIDNLHFNDVYKKVYEKEKIKLSEWLKTNFQNNGIYEKNYNNYTNINLNHDFTVIDTKAFVENSTLTNISAFFFLILYQINGKIMSNHFINNKKSLLVFDELHKFMGEKHTEILDFVFDSAKTIRKFQGSLVLATQNPTDLGITQAISNKTSGILKNIQYKFFFNLPGEDIKLINNIYSPENNESFNLLNKYDSDFLLNSGRGECLLVSSQKKKVYFKFMYNDFEKKFFFKEKVEK